MQVVEIRLQSWCPVGLEVVRTTAAFVKLDLSHVVHAQKKERRFMLCMTPMEKARGLQMTAPPVIQVTFSPQIVFPGLLFCVLVASSKSWIPLESEMNFPDSGNRCLLVLFHANLQRFILLSVLSCSFSRIPEKSV